MLHDKLPFPENFPTPHRLHAADDAAADWDDDLPASQAVQDVDDAEGLNLPASHGEHLDDPDTFL